MTFPQALFDRIATVLVMLLSLTLLWKTLGPTLELTPPRAAAKIKSEPPLPREPVSLAGAQMKGDPAARVVLMEYSDFQCPYCERFTSTVLPSLIATYVDKGRIAIAFKQFPLTQIHPFAMPAALAAQCAGEQKHFWNMHDLIFASQQTLSTADFHKDAQALKLNVRQFDACVASEATRKHVQQDMADGTALSISSTPAFLVGYREKGAYIHVTKRLTGAQPLVQFAQALDDALVTQPVKAASATTR